METTATQSNIQELRKEKDNSASTFSVKDIGDTIFKRAENDKEVVFLMGNNMIQKFDKNDYKWWYSAFKTEMYLRRIPTKLLIPMIAAITETILTERSKQKEDRK